MDEKEEKWEITDIDITKHTPEEWANIYGIKLMNHYSGFYNEFEWAYNFDNFYYIPVKKTDGIPDWDSIEEKKLRAALIKKDIFVNADPGEKEMLKEKFIETDWIRQKTLHI